LPGGNIGPDLDLVYGSSMGRRPGFNSSPTLKDHTAGWGADSLNGLLTDPSAFVPGSPMQVGAVADLQTRRLIIGYLKWQREKSGILAY
jgi:cytochrome c